MRASKVTVIPPRAGHLTSAANLVPATKRVAAYARVSTDHEEQQSSYEAQVDYFTKHIISNPAWQFVEVYSDEGISATQLKYRIGFNRMVADALAGKIDLILTKSISRFARNTVDTLTIIRKLKDKGVEVYFEKENIFTFDSKGELMITLLSSLAQEESRSLSLNISWGQRKRFADGKFSLPYGRFLGYEKGDDDLPRIVEKEAEIVRMIYKMFLSGNTPSGIARYLTRNKIPTPGNGKSWGWSTVKSILTNEKFKGDAKLQKGYTVDFLTKKRKINEGELPQYYVENSHPAIVSPEVFELVQEEFRRRHAAGKCTSAINCFASRIVCGECGGFYGRKVWHSNNKYTTTVWHCNNKFKNRTYCKTPHLKEEILKNAFTDAFNSIIDNRDYHFKLFEKITDKLTNTNALEKKSNKLEADSKVIESAIEKLIAENARVALDQKSFNEKYSDFLNRHKQLQTDRESVINEITHRNAKRIMISNFLEELKKREHLMKEFDEDLWNATLTHVIVKSTTEVVFKFKDGQELPWKIKQK